MSNDAERDLIELVSREQRGFRFILFAGLAVLIVLVGMSAALGFYYYRVSQTLADTSRELQHQAFDARIRMDQQNNRVNAQEVRLRAIQEEIRVSAGGAASSASLSDALAATRLYLRRGSHPLSSERLIEGLANNAGGKSSEPPYALVSGAAALIGWLRSGASIPADASALPDQLAAANAAFERAKADPALAPAANAGLAWVLFLNAQRTNYATADCEAVFSAIDASKENGSAGPQPLYWRAQCERKLGRTRDSLLDYAHALALSQDGSGRANDPAEIELAMNAFHGVGTTMIAAFGTHEDNDIRAALELAERSCTPDQAAEGSPRMHLARACLSRAMELRRRLQQTPNQVSGTGENLGLTYLRDENYDGALQHANNVHETGLFAWNELIRALSASHASSAQAGPALRDARQNVSFFRIGQFNLCELQVLLNEEHYAEALELIKREHPGEEVACAAAA